MANKEFHIDWLEIRNFKSIKASYFNCKKINLFIGKPNVGKSNILESVGLLGGMNSWKKEKIFSEFVRYEKTRNLFYDNDRSLDLEIHSNLGFCKGFYHANSLDAYEFITDSDENYYKDYRKWQKNNTNYNFNELKAQYSSPDHILDASINKYGISIGHFFANNDGKIIGENVQPNLFLGNIKKYDFVKNLNKTDRFSAFLAPPNGKNLFTVIENEKKLSDEIADIFESYGLTLLIDGETSELSIQKVIGRTSIRIPYSLMADTLQRYIFNLAAIRTNKNSIIVLEEPEAHSFPTYISEIGNEIVNDKNNNQYFIATHSPYLLSEIIEKTGEEDLAIFLCDYVDYETKVKQLSSEEISNILENDVDLFYNLSAFQ